MEQLEANGFTVDKVFYTEVNPEVLKYYRGIVIFRCPLIDALEEIITKARYYNKAVFYDIDDLVMDKKYTSKIEYVKEMSDKDRAVYDDGVERMGKTMKLCDYCITTTSALARELKKYGKEVYVNRNVASEEMVRLSIQAKEKVTKDDKKVKIGYLSGSITHNPDFELIKTSLIRILDEYPQTELCVMGHLGVPAEFDRFGDRIIKLPFRNWKKLPEVIAGLDINLAPIEKTIFNEAKSENKWMEAALCGVVTVASDFGAFKETIIDGKTGMLCENSEDWYLKIRKLIEDSNLRESLAQRAFDKAKREYITTYTGVGLARFIESKMAKSVVFVLPSTNINFFIYPPTMIIITKKLFFFNIYWFYIY